MSQAGVFGTEMHLATFILIVLEIALLSYQIPNYLVRLHDESRSRYLILIILFIYYNLASGLLPDPAFPIPELLQHVIAYSGGIFVAIYYFYYLTAEMGIQFNRYFKFRFLLITVSAIFVLGYVGTWLITGGDMALSRAGFMWYPVLLALVLLSKLVISIHQLGKEADGMNPVHSRALYLNYLGSFTMAMLPCIAFFGEFQTAEVLVTNASLGLTTIAYLQKWMHQSKQEYEWLSSVGFQNEQMQDYTLLLQLRNTLSTREMEIVPLLLRDDLKYEHISEQLFIGPKTVSKHASNIFKKVEVANRGEFIQKYARLQVVVGEEFRLNTY